MKTGYILGIARGHNASVCLLKDGEIVFSIEEERLSRKKYDGGPFAAMIKVLDYTDKIDYLVIAHTQDLKTAGRIDFSGDDVYTGLARKLRLIENADQVIDLSHMHHKLHAAAAFYRSGFDTATSVIVDGAGTFITIMYGETPITFWEVESIFTCNYPSDFKTLYKHLGTREPIVTSHIKEFDSKNYNEEGTHEIYIDDRAGIVKTYEAVTQYCGFSAIEAGKTMGLFPYGKKNNKLPSLFDDLAAVPTSNRNLIIPTYPNGAFVNEGMSKELSTASKDVTTLQNRRDLAYAVQTQSQDQVVTLIKKAVNETGIHNVIVSGGYGLNCVANYHYLDALKDENINLYVEPISNDAGTAIGAALLLWHNITGNTTPKEHTTLYLGPTYNYTLDDVTSMVSSVDNAMMRDVTKKDVVQLLQQKNIVAMFQGRSENGPRALGNRSILFDPTYEHGKEFVNTVKHREYFRPFAGTVMAEHADAWFNLRGMKESPFMMYAVNCQDGVAEKIPAIIHVDGTCRIQTVTPEQNKHFHELIACFYEATDIPILFNTSFNLGGEPLVETLQDAIRTLAASEIEYLYLPEYNKLIEVKNVIT